MSIYETDIWRLGIIKTSLDNVIQNKDYDIHWLADEKPFQFLADPFGIYKDNQLYIFAEEYDYRDRHGRIAVLIYNNSLELLDRRIVLEKPWHLSYPMMMEDNGDIYMLPEAYQSGRTTLYKAVNFPYQWEEVHEFSFPEIVIDPTLLFYNQCWWMFYTPADSEFSRQSALSIAYAPNLMGPWSLHTHNPVRVTPASARPGGSAVIIGDNIILPTQDCTQTYGGGLSFLKISSLTSESFEATVMDKLEANKSIFNDYNKGVHTLSAVNKQYTLIDAKKMLQQPIDRLCIDIGYKIKKKLHLL